MNPTAAPAAAQRPVETYGEAGMRERLEFWALLLLWWGLMIVAFALLPRDVNGGLAFGVLLGLGAFALAPLTFLSRWQRHRMAMHVSEALAEAGFTVLPEPAEAERRAVLDRLGALALLRNNTEDVSWIAYCNVAGCEVTVLHHTHIDGAGRYWYDRTSTVVATPFNDPRPGVWLTRTNAVTAQRDADSGYVQDLEIGDAWFDENFRIQSHDADSLQRILTPAVRQFIATGPWKESWTIGYGYVVCVFGADTTADGIGVMIRRTQALVELLRTPPA